MGDVPISACLGDVASADSEVSMLTNRGDAEPRRFRKEDLPNKDNYHFSILAFADSQSRL
jgi:hypothetical protein